MFTLILVANEHPLTKI